MVSGPLHSIAPAVIHYQVAKTRIGKELYSKIAGYSSLSLEASPLNFDAVLKIGSCTKLITSIALLQCVEKGLVGLDKSLSKLFPELDGKEIIKG
jgi:CubicO group peptidase (beta-lactamase class C family)